MKDWLTCIALLRAFGTRGRRDTAHLWRRARPFERRMIAAHLLTHIENYDERLDRTRRASAEIGADTEYLEANWQSQRKLESWFAVLTTNEQPSSAELAAATAIEDWHWVPTDTAVYARGQVDGRDWTTSEVVEIDRRRQWVRDKDGRLWRLGDLTGS